MMDDKRHRLRRRAEEQVARSKKPSEDIKARETAKLLEELKIHQIELELQNEKLRKSQAETEKARKDCEELWEFSPVGYAIVDSQGRISKVNRSAQRLFGRPRNALLGERFTSLLGPENQVAVHLLLEGITAGEISSTYEVRTSKPDGSFCTCNLTCQPCAEESERRHIQAVLTDISDLKQANDRRLESEERFQMMADSSPTMIWVTDGEGRTQFVNKAFLEFFGAEPEQISGFGWKAFIHPDNVQEYLDLFLKQLRAREPFHAETCVRRADGQWRWLDSHGIPRFSAGGEFLGMVGSSPDITELRQSIDELQEIRETLEAVRKDLKLKVRERTAALEEQYLEQQRMNRLLSDEVERRKQYEADLKEQGEKLLGEIRRRAYLSKKLVTLLERDRREISSALHDEVGQILTTVQMDLDAIKRGEQKDRVVLENEIERLQKTIFNAVTLIRELGRQLRPDILLHLGLVPAVKNLIQRIEERSEMTIHFFTKGVADNIGDVNGLAAYRIIQESLTNVIRYSGAENVFISLIQKGKTLRLSVEDDGVGFDQARLAEKDGSPVTLGITIMEERAAQVGGEFCLESHVGKGTQVMAEIPVRA